MSHHCVILLIEGDLRRGLGKCFNSSKILANLTGISFFKNLTDVSLQASTLPVSLSTREINES